MGLYRRVFAAPEGPVGQPKLPARLMRSLDPSKDRVLEILLPDASLVCLLPGAR